MELVMKIKLHYLLVALSLLVIVSCNTTSQKKAKLQAYDVLALPGENVTLQAKLEKRGGLGMKPDIEGSLIYFHHENGAFDTEEIARER